eukprot:6492166-Amphidinium_carterae.1
MGSSARTSARLRASSLRATMRVAMRSACGLKGTAIPRISMSSVVPQILELKSRDITEKVLNQRASIVEVLLAGRDQVQVIRIERKMDGGETLLKGVR